MKTIDLGKQALSLPEVFDSAGDGPVLLVTDDGREFILGQADNFEDEVETLRNSLEFQKFLEDRMKCETRFSIEDIEDAGNPALSE